MTERHIGIYNRFWTTAGGGETFAAGIASALAGAGRFRVELIGHGGITVAELAQRLGLDLTGVTLRDVDIAPSAVEAASADYDLFVNASYGSVLRSRAPHGLYVVHFPTIGAPPPTGWRRFALRAVGRLARLTGARLQGAAWTGGVYAVEPFGPLTHRWTDGEGVLRVTDGPRRGRMTLVFGRLIDPAADRVEVEVWAGSRRLAGRRIAAARARDGLPLCFLRLRLPDGRADRATLQVRSATHLPVGRSSDQRRLGVSVVAVLVGPYRQQLLQLVHQPLSAAAADLAFLDSYDEVVANSAFTAAWVRRLWGRDAPLLHPPVATQPAGTKERVILHVGRFFPPAAGHSKRQLELVRAFRTLVGQGAAHGWELHLVGGCDEEGQPYLEEVHAEIGDLAVHLHPNAPRSELRALFARAAIYWHATGLGTDPDEHPERMEHFGISTVEAMSAGAVPVVIGVAGQLEVFDDGVEGYHFHTVQELVSHTARLVADPSGRARLGAAAQRRAHRYDEAAFRERLLALVDQLTA